MLTNVWQTWRDLVSTVSLVLVIATLPNLAAAQPQPGDLFREYRWTNSEGDAGQSLRVGGKLDYGGDAIQLAQSLDLEQAVRSEVVIEKLLCHDGTRGLSISVNNHPWIKIPESASMPDPPADYQHHTFPVVDVPLDQLVSGVGNQFRLKVSQQHHWNWPQNLIYGVHFRIYYLSEKKSHPTGRIASQKANAGLGRSVLLQAETSSPVGRVQRVDFVGCFKGVNLEGDGRYRQWHYRYDRGRLVGHLGTATVAPWAIQWDTSWVPDQQEPMRLAAWITDESGLTWFTQSIDGLTFDRQHFSVELCQPYDVPPRWVTRSGEHQEHFQIAGNLEHAQQAQLVWHSWSPGYMEGIFINGQRVFDREGPRYASYVHRVVLDDLSMLREGENTLTTGKTPKYGGEMVHGMEVNWPGIMVLVQYDQTKRNNTAVEH